MIDEKALTKEMAVWFRELIYVRDNISWRPGLLAPPPALPGQVDVVCGRLAGHGERPRSILNQVSLMHVSRQRNLSVTTALT